MIESYLRDNPEIMVIIIVFGPAVIITGLIYLTIFLYKKWKEKRDLKRWSRFKNAIHSTMFGKYNQILIDKTMEFLEDYYGLFCIYGKDRVVEGLTRDLYWFVDDQIQKLDKTIDYRVQFAYNDYIKSRNSQETTGI